VLSLLGGVELKGDVAIVGQVDCWLGAAVFEDALFVTDPDWKFPPLKKHPHLGQQPARKPRIPSQMLVELQASKQFDLHCHPKLRPLKHPIRDPVERCEIGIEEGARGRLERGLVEQADPVVGDDPGVGGEQGLPE
jgi:hypothetical protein